MEQVNKLQALLRHLEPHSVKPTKYFLKWLRDQALTTEFGWLPVGTWFYAKSFAPCATADVFWIKTGPSTARLFQFGPVNGAIGVIKLKFKDEDRVVVLTRSVHTQPYAEREVPHVTFDADFTIQSLLATDPEEDESSSL